MTARLPKRLDSIQALRGIAAMLVLFFHIAEFQRDIVGPNSPDLLMLSGLWDRGWVGVDLFFVISGFIMVYVTQRTGRSLTDVRRFLWARLTRIYPLWWICAAVMACYFFITYGMPAAPDRFATPRLTWEYALKSFALIPQDNLPILNLGWTLIHELFFYAVFALLLLMPRHLLPAGLFIWAILTCLMAVFVMPSLNGGSFLKLVTSPLSLEFIAGALAAILLIQKPAKRPQFSLCLGGIIAMIGMIVFPMIGAGRVTMFLIPMTLIVYGAAALEAGKKMTVPRWLSTLGNWSYSLYLTHYIVLVAMRRLHRGFPEGAQLGVAGIWDNLAFAALAIVLCVCVASLTFNFIENPLLSYFKQKRLAETA